MSHEFKKARTVGRRELWKGSVGSFGEDEVELPDGKHIRLALLKHPGAAAVVPFLDKDSVLLLRQYRYAAGDTLWEIPAGKLDPGEAPEVCAGRELKEETGYSCSRLVPLGHVLTTPGFTDEVIHLYAAFGLTQGETNLDADEMIQATAVPFAKALEMARAGVINDGKSVVALFRAEYLQHLFDSP